MSAASVQIFSPFKGRRCQQADEVMRHVWPDLALRLIRRFVTPSPRKRGTGR
jgi:hypothetical protein